MGIDSISLNPDTVVRTIPMVLEAERERDMLSAALSSVSSAGE
jgi:hypothetical protein